MLVLPTALLGPEDGGQDLRGQRVVELASQPRTEQEKKEADRWKDLLESLSLRIWASIRCESFALERIDHEKRVFGLVMPFQGRSPRWRLVFVAPTAIVVGDVSLGEGSSVWFGAVIRGDVHWVRIGQNTNIQDQSVVHVTTDRHSTEVGSFVTVGHGL